MSKASAARAGACRVKHKSGGDKCADILAILVYWRYSAVCRYFADILPNFSEDILVFENRE